MTETIDKTIRIGIVGSRARNSREDKNIIKNLLIKKMKQGRRFHIVSGGCPRGADRFAEECAKELGIPITIYYPDKSKLPDNPKNYDWAKVFYERNTWIAEDCDVLLAMVHDDRKGGTEDTIKKAEKFGKKIILV